MLPFREGTWFALPLRTEGFAVGVVARTTEEGRVILAYLFGPKRNAAPQLAEVDSLRSDEATRVLRVGDLGLIEGSWTVLGDSRDWVRSRWPMPAFVRRDELSGRAWRVVYSDSDPNRLLGEEEIPFDSAGLERDAVFGAGAVELLMTKLLS